MNNMKTTKQKIALIMFAITIFVSFLYAIIGAFTISIQAGFVTIAYIMWFATIIYLMFSK